MSSSVRACIKHATGAYVLRNRRLARQLIALLQDCLTPCACRFHHTWDCGRGLIVYHKVCYRTIPDVVFPLRLLGFDLVALGAVGAAVLALGLCLPAGRALSRLCMRPSMRY